MRFAGNVLWIVFGGGLVGLVWLLGALITAITIIGLPLSRACLEMAKLTFAPFGRDVVHIRELDARDDDMAQMTGVLGIIVNVLWAVTFGILLCAGYVVLGVLWCLTLIGIPFGLQCFKLAGISFWPVGRRVVSKELAEEARRMNAREDLDRYRERGAARRREAGEPRKRVAPRRHDPDGYVEPDDDRWIGDQRSDPAFDDGYDPLPPPPEPRRSNPASRAGSVTPEPVITPRRRADPRIDYDRDPARRREAEEDDYPEWYKPQRGRKPPDRQEPEF